MNRVVLKGRLTRKPEIKYSQSVNPIAVANFGIAINGYNDRVDFINCSGFGKTAEFLEKYFDKGQEILLEGRIQVDKVNTDGVDKTFTKVVAEHVEFCGSKADSNSNSNANNNTASNEEDDDLPF